MKQGKQIGKISKLIRKIKTIFGFKKMNKDKSGWALKTRKDKNARKQ